MGVPGRLFERLTGAGFSGQMDYDVGHHVLQHRIPGACLCDVRNDEFSRRVELGGTFARGVDLGVEVIDDDDAVECLDQ
jgi:hypothetical protein